MRQQTGESREWSLYWTARGQPVPRQRVPVLAAWADLDERESAAGIEPRHSILTDPEFRIDPVLARFLTRSRFTWLAEGTRQAYAHDYRLFSSWMALGSVLTWRSSVLSSVCRCGSPHRSGAFLS